MRAIERVAVIGAGTMGSQIAALIAASNTTVFLLDLASPKSSGRNKIAQDALWKLRTSNHLPLADSQYSLIEPGNIEDDLMRLKGVDWVIECVPEDLTTKQEVYKRIVRYLKKGTLISSNTSAIPLYRLKEGLSDELRQCVCVAHFYNPPFQLPLVEMVADLYNDVRAVENIKLFADVALGRNVIFTHDTSGFIANRIGMYWLLSAMEEAARENLPIELADAVMNGCFGFPRTGIFALADLIGLKLIPDVVGLMQICLPYTDSLQMLSAPVELILKVAEEAAEGEKPGFYMTVNGKKKAWDLQSRTYRDYKPRSIQITHCHRFLTGNTPESRFAIRTLTRLLSYAIQITPEIANNILDVDAALQNGYGWKYGPFGIIDRLGPAWLSEQMEKQKLPVPFLLKQAAVQGFCHYSERHKGEMYLDFSGFYHRRILEREKWTLCRKTAGTKPLMESEAVRLWDIEDNIGCLEIKEKRHPDLRSIFSLLMRGIEKAEKLFDGLIISYESMYSGETPGETMIASILDNDRDYIESLLECGQDCMQRIKYARIPIVFVASSHVSGWVCELMMHCCAVQAYKNVRIGMVEKEAETLPVFGGIRECLRQAIKRCGGDAEQLTEDITMSFRQMAYAMKSRNAVDAFAMQIIAPPSRVTANKDRLLPDAKELCILMIPDYEPKRQLPIRLPVRMLYESLKHEIMEIVQREHPLITRYRYKMLELLAETLSGVYGIKTKHEDREHPGWHSYTQEQFLQMNLQAFMELMQSEEARAKIRNSHPAK
ncbi:MAG TPA: 3-hydroxyacyl-CoA dehydrogenase NAD-binding domain-containing protein [Rickettsiales bacterium]|nr:3-hydroxyacyl-CoA dehydrogenase NAD-binding domain-containing protein [Rickettsiales bacterium]